MPERNDMDTMGLFSAPPSINVGYAPAQGAHTCKCGRRWRPISPMSTCFSLYTLLWPAC